MLSSLKQIFVEYVFCFKVKINLNSNKHTGTYLDTYCIIITVAHE